MADPVVDSFSVNPNGYQFDTSSAEAQYKRQWLFDAGRWWTGNESYSDWVARNQNFLDRLYEQDTLAQQRQYELYADSTRYQRLVKDLKAAGLNPWLALNGGSSSAGSVSIAGQGGSSMKSSYKAGTGNDNSNKNFSQVAKLFSTAISSAMMVAMMFA